MGHQEYLLSYGTAGDFGRFRAPEPLACRRGERLVVRSPRGQEIAVVLCAAGPGHNGILADAFVGEILRPATPGDLELAERMQRRSQALFEHARRVTAELQLPLEILDVEILLDGRQAVLHHVRWAECDPRPLMDPLAQGHHLLVTLHDLALPPMEPEPAEPTGCGREGCGAGGCGSCASGTCSTCRTHQPHASELSRVSLL
jgi:hypothetical protein